MSPVTMYQKATGSSVYLMKFCYVLLANVARVDGVDGRGAPGNASNIGGFNDVKTREIGACPKSPRSLVSRVRG